MAVNAQSTEVIARPAIINKIPGVLQPYLQPLISPRCVHIPRRPTLGLLHGYRAIIRCGLDALVGLASR